MLNIVINEPDVLFRQGLTYLLADLFAQKDRPEIRIDVHSSPAGILLADMLVLSLAPGECFTCFTPSLAGRKGVAIGLVDACPEWDALPSCFEDMLFIARRAPLMQMRLTLEKAWARRLLHDAYRRPSSCADCQYRGLTPQQVRVMQELHQGLSIADTAQRLGIAVKTVFSHKYAVMEKYRLRSDYELTLFLHRMAEKRSGFSAHSLIP